MNVELYTVLTGRTYATDEHRFIDAQIKRAKRQLESLLGFTLDPDLVNKNFYNETGKTLIECSCPNVTDTLLDPDIVVGAYRLYSYNALDEYLHIDPFYEIFKVKLVRFDGADGITVKEFTEFTPIYKEDWGKYIEVCDDCCFCTLCEDCTDCLQLAVDADWAFPNTADSTIGDSSVGGTVTAIPDDLLYVWCDLTDYLVGGKENIKSESIGSHSYTKFDKDSSPLDKLENKQVLAKYAGPKGSMAKRFV
jgi:hypothetical protein